MKSSRTQITFLKPKDFPEALQIFKQKDALIYIEPLQNLSDDEYFQRFQKKYEEYKNGSGFHFVARMKDSRELIGILNLNPMPGSSDMYIGYIINKTYWNKGYGSELAAWVKDYAIQKAGLVNVFALIEDTNKASKKILEKLGFTLNSIKTENEIILKTYKFVAKEK